MKSATIIFLFVCNVAIAQENLVKWTATLVDVKDGNATVRLTAILKDRWWIFSSLPGSGLLPTQVFFKQDESYTLVDTPSEEGIVLCWRNKLYDRDFRSAQGSFSYSQKIKLNTRQTTIEGTVDYMPHNSQVCREPQRFSFSLDVGSNNQKDKPAKQKKCTSPLGR